MQECKSFDIPPKVLYVNRYCNQDDFSVLVCGGKNKKREVIYKLYGCDLKPEKITYIPKALKKCKTAVINSNLFVLGEYSNRSTYNKSVRKLFLKNKTWSSKAQLCLNKNPFCICSFKKNLYVIDAAGRFFVYNLKNDKWIQKNKTKQRRGYAACTVFEGKIVVTGGIYKWIRLQSVEAYDYDQNRWNFLPEMLKRRYNHSSVSMGNKMFIIGEGYTNVLGCEMFDSLAKKFTYISSDTIKRLNQYKSEAMCGGDKIVGFFESSIETFVYIYDIINDRWSEKKIDIVSNLTRTSYIKCYLV